MSFSQCRNNKNTIYFFSKQEKKITSPANEFLLQKFRNNRKIYIFVFFKSEKCTSPANEFLLQRYSETMYKSI